MLVFHLYSGHYTHLGAGPGSSPETGNSGSVDKICYSWIYISVVLLLFQNLRQGRVSTSLLHLCQGTEVWEGKKKLRERERLWNALSWDDQQAEFMH